MYVCHLGGRRYVTPLVFASTLLVQVRPALAIMGH
jgi:hypothetical protein